MLDREVAQLVNENKKAGTNIILLPPANVGKVINV
jgi:hypothetical protein